MMTEGRRLRQHTCRKNASESFCFPIQITHVSLWGLSRQVTRGVYVEVFCTFISYIVLDLETLETVLRSKERAGCTCEEDQQTDERERETLYPFGREGHQ